MITVNWDNVEQTIIRLDYADPVKSWDEYHEAIEKTYEMVQSKSYTVHMIHNPGKTKMPPGNPLFHITKAIRTLPQNAGLILMIIEDMMARRVVEAVVRLLIAKNAGFATSVDNAHERIKEADRKSA